MAVVPALTFVVLISYFGSDYPRTPLILVLLGCIAGAFWYKNYCSTNFTKYIDFVVSEKENDASELTRLIELGCSVQLEALVYDKLANVVLGFNSTEQIPNRTIDLLVRKSLRVPVVNERLLPHVYKLVNKLRQSDFPFQHQTIQLTKRILAQK
ncbi:MAG: hypothetical protein KF836_02765 [Fimbriimonadaceae bacterium]|nr:hypothetical protein [Fimbriimonadaceae bacterium]